MSQARIVIVEDEPDILEVTEYNLKREGYSCIGVRDGDTALRTIRSELPDLVLLDLMLPGLDGLEVCRELKADPATRGVPVIMVTAKGEESEIVLGLGLGADDYVTKPFSPRELMARVRAVLRRSAAQAESEVADRIQRAGLVIDSTRHEVTVHGEAVSLTATEFRLLRFLARHPGRVFTRDHLLGRVIGENAVVLDRNIDVHVRSVRRKLGDLRDSIETVRGVGYRFREVEE